MEENEIASEINTEDPIKINEILNHGSSIVEA